jgi:Zn-finger protein
MDTGEGKIWDCSRCNFIHRFDVQARIIELFYKHKNLEEIERIIENEFESS